MPYREGPLAFELIGDDSEPEGMTVFQSFVMKKRHEHALFFFGSNHVVCPSTLRENKRSHGPNHNGGGDGGGGGDGDGNGSGDGDGGGGGNHRESSSNFWIHNLHRGLIVDCALFNIKICHRDKP